MKCAFLADIHGNYEALAAVLAEIDSSAPDAIFCGGDLVGYGADPDRCIETIASLQIPCVAGNHDLAVTGTVDMQYFNDNARDAVLWTQARLGRAAVDYLASLPLRIDSETFTLVHGAFPNPGAFDYILTLQDALHSFGVLDRDFGVTAHSHVPLALVHGDDAITAGPIDDLAVPAGSRAIVNVGSVGQPRDWNPMAAFVLLDTVTRRLTLRRVTYDVEGAAQRILQAGLPPANAHRLLEGR